MIEEFEGRLIREKKSNKREIKNVVIIAPHGDDEIIGCHSILKNNKSIIIYTSDMDDVRKQESLKLKEHFDVKFQLFTKTIPDSLLNSNNTLYFPDPIYEIHHDHRLQGMVGEQLVRSGLDVVFYSVNMNSPYCHSVKHPDEKEESLNKVYPSQKDLWKYEKKYVLFEGYNKWLM